MPETTSQDRPTATIWPWFGFWSSLAADAAPIPLSPAQIASTTGQALLSEHSNDAIWGWSAGGPLTNKNEHPGWSETAKTIAPIKPALAIMTFHPSTKNSFPLII
jgi:hypothetical protein